MKNRSVDMCRLCVAFLMIFMAQACGSEPNEPKNEADVGIDVISGADVDDGDAAHDAGADDVGDGDTADPDASREPDGNDDVGEELDGGDTGDVGSEPVQADYLICTSDFDCPINGSVCTKWVPLNRVDGEGVEEILLSDLFEDLEADQGVCTQPCSSDPTVCAAVTWPDDRGRQQPSSCVVVATGASPYRLISEDPFEVEVDLTEMQAGQAFGAICMPAFDQAPGRPADFCHACTGPAGCGEESRCFNLMTGAVRESAEEQGQSFCLERCADQADCPQGFACLSDDEEAEGLCVPMSGTCSACIDHDGDGFGTGHCGPASARQTPYDCDDTNAQIYYDPANPYHSFPAQCGAFDNNCDGLRDDVQMIGSEQWGNEHCTACGDTCEGTAPGGMFNCGVDAALEPLCKVECEAGRANCNGDWSDGCEVDVADAAYQYWQDADGDGFGDDALGPHFFCTLEDAQAGLTNPVEQGGDCDDDDMETYPGAPELCNGKVNDCSGQNPITGELAGAAVTIGDACTVPDVYGICAAGEVDCGAEGLYCKQTVFPAAFETCNGLDDTCNGLIDEGHVRGADGQERVGDGCDTGLRGECRNGAKTCVAQGTGIAVPLQCVQNVFPTLERPGFDGIDHSCDGFDRYAREDGTPHVVFVRPASGLTLNAAIEEAATATSCALTVGTRPNPTVVPCDVFVQSSLSHVSPSTIALREGIDIYGGFSAEFATWRVGDTFTAPSYGAGAPASRITVQAPSDGSAVVGLRGEQIESPTHLYGIEIVTQDVNQAGANAHCSANVGMICRQCEGLRLKQFYVESAGAGPGLEGSHGAPGANGGNGQSQSLAGSLNNSFCARGGTSPPGHLGGSSGRCGDTSVVQRYGWPGIGPRGGEGGTSGSMDGRHGGGGVALAQPASKPTFGGILADLSFDCERNHDGASSEVNHGSGGGGSWVFQFPATNSNHGAGGGGGGEAGGAGQGGGAGAPSIAFLLVDTAGGIDFDGVRFRAGNGGEGGDGGAGAQGGLGGSRASNTGVDGGHGGHGAGGNGGNGGNGGPSVAFLRHNATVGRVQGENFVAGMGGSGGSGGDAGPGQDSSTNLRIAEPGNPGNDGTRGVTCKIFEQSPEHGGATWPIVIRASGCIN